MRKDTQAVLLLLVGATLLKISFAGTYVRYVKAGLFPLLIITGVVLIVVGAFTLWQVIRPWTRPADPQPETETAEPARSTEPEPSVAGVPVSGSPAQVAGAHRAAAAYALHEGHRAEEFEAEVLGTEVSALSGATMALPVIAVPSARKTATTGSDRERVDDDDDVDVDDDDDDDDHDRGRVGWLLLVPALALLLFAPPALGSFQASRNGTALATAAESDFPPLPAGDPVRITLLDYASRAVFDQGRSLTGRTVLLTGFIIAGPNGEPYLARMVVGCCAADGRPVKVGLTGDVPVDLGPDTWIEAEGSYLDHADRDPVNGELVPYLQVTSVRSIPPPTEQYE